MNPTTTITTQTKADGKDPATLDKTEAKRKLETHAEDAKARSREALEGSKEALSEATDRFKEQTRHAAETVRDRAQETGERVKEQSFAFLDRQKKRMASEVQALSDAARKASLRLEEDSDTNLAKYVSQGADRLERLRRRMEQTDVRTALRELEDYTRRHPEVIFGGLFVAGLAFTRFLKASKPRKRKRVELQETVEVVPARQSYPRALGEGNGRPGPSEPAPETGSTWGSASAGSGSGQGSLPTSSGRTPGSTSPSTTPATGPGRSGGPGMGLTGGGAKGSTELAAGSTPPESGTASPKGADTPTSLHKSHACDDDKSDDKPKR